MMIYNILIINMNKYVIDDKLLDLLCKKNKQKFGLSNKFLKRIIKKNILKDDNIIEENKKNIW